jgi:hypothetical protein
VPLVAIGWVGHRIDVDAVERREVLQQPNYPEYSALWIKVKFSLSLTKYYVMKTYGGVEV